ncbi:SBBP repeat-containing protein [Funiculus sociatus GB2-A5]|uniref:SBBP repeat-containing protein n=1 Tax=Funiculus sociatus GB2-A5 TaxID=2933946 RepID=A0ABV0JNW0_9CYAN|nr:SBBP repeat-containing protein [Trichocoleus sp. FACHB-69]MBD1908571.1 SBBP repeat-containing protein [Trichocoleus sp. FACHB-832]MBD1932435.1 SBBP repeat-containing protein [Trichocoleus sp. FACHB-69]MBD2063903.1 SBBP repeat-containing protein [Trichocoleus sp. FACHB-6]
MDKQKFYDQILAEGIKPGGSISKKVKDLFSGKSGVDIPESKKNPKKNLPEGFRESEISRVSNEVTIPEFTIQVYTPGSDLAAATAKNQVIYARDGNDTLIGLDPFNNKAGQVQIDILIGDLPIIQPPNPRDWTDRFVLGDSKQPYYVDGGFKDFALILDFNPSQDIIQLHGSRQDYLLAESGLGTEIYYQPKKGTSEFIGFLPFVYDLSLKGGYFRYEGKGNTPPNKPVVKQAEQLGTSRFDITASVVADAFGNVYTAGGTSGSLGGANAGERDALLVKYDSDGNQTFIKQFGSSRADTVYGMATDSQGNVYLTGITAGNLAEPKQGTSTDAWVAKYDRSGKRLWIDQFGTDIINQSFDVDVDDDGNVYVAGITVKSGEPGGTLPATDDYWVTKYDTNGKRQWFKEFDSTSANPSDLDFDEAYGVAVTGDGNVYASGWTLGNLAGKNAGLYDAWVGKYDTNGNQEWVKQFGTSTYEFSWDVDTDTQGNAYAVGWTLGDLGGKNAGLYDAWLVKYDSDGNQKWLKQFGTSGDDEAFGVETDLAGNIYVVGYTDKSLKGTNAGSFDAWVVKYDTNGNRKWTQQFGTPNLDQALGVSIDDITGSLYVTGATESSFGDSPAGSVDSWVAKLDANSGSLQSFTGTANNKPSGKNVTGTNGDDRIISAKGRDIITGLDGSDIFVYNSYKDGGDTITDFSANEDFIDLSPIFASPNYRSTEPFDDYVQLVQLGSSTAVQINPVGDARDTFRTLVTLENFTASNLSADNFIV